MCVADGDWSGGSGQRSQSGAPWTHRTRGEIDGLHEIQRTRASWWQGLEWVVTIGTFHACRRAPSRTSAN